MLQRTILRNFLGRSKTKHRLDTKPQMRVSDDHHSFLIKHNSDLPNNHASIYNYLDQ